MNLPSKFRVKTVLNEYDVEYKDNGVYAVSWESYFGAMDKLYTHDEITELVSGGLWTIIE